MTINPALSSYNAAQYWLAANAKLNATRAALEAATFEYQRALREEIKAREIMAEELAADEEAEGERA